jgi:superfamily I DNA/RNA helicase
VLDLSRLTDQQRRIVLSPDGPLLVQAGPGTGKTTLLAARIAYLVAVRGLDPAGILAMSFTRVAASQLRERLRGLLGDQGKDVAVFTCHALGLRIARQWQEELGFGSRPLIVYGQYEARRALTAAAEQCQVDLKRVRLADLAEEVDEFRLNGCCSLDLGLVRAVAAAYEALLRTRGALDFPAMLALPLRACEPISKGSVQRSVQISIRRERYGVGEGSDGTHLRTPT